MKIRLATPGDAPALSRIYAPYVLNTSVTFEYEPPSPEEFERRILHTLERYPYLAAEENGILLGYAYASPFQERAAYDWSAETSVYVRQDCRRAGVGSALYDKLEELLYRQHVCNLCACIAYPNPASIAFHERRGYQRSAYFHRSGYKLGAWQDMIWMERTLYPHSGPPLPFLPFPQINDPVPEPTAEP